jgi:hypothetical protein
VYRQNGSRVVRQEVVTGAMNDHDVVIVHGLSEGDRVLLAEPDAPGSLPLERLPEDQRPAPDSSTAAAPARTDSTPRRR